MVNSKRLTSTSPILEYAALDNGGETDGLTTIDFLQIGFDEDEGGTMNDD